MFSICIVPSNINNRKKKPTEKNKQKTFLILCTYLLSSFTALMSTLIITENNPKLL